MKHELYLWVSSHSPKRMMEIMANYFSTFRHYSNFYVYICLYLVCCLFLPENKLSGRKALSNSMVAVDEVVPTLKDPRDAHYYEQLAVEDLERKFFKY